MSNASISASPVAYVAAQAAATQNPHLRKIRDLIYQVAGILQPDHKLQFLEDRCRRRMQQLNISSHSAYYDCLTLSSVRNEEMKQLLNEITIGETCFFRNSPQLEALRTIVLPAILKSKSHLAYRHLRLWSAGCSTGEEAYTLAILLLEERERGLKNVAVEVLATDLNVRSLEAAQAGIYGEYALRNVGPAMREKYFTPAGQRLAVKPEVKSLVKFSRLNLIDDARMTFMKGMDVIFCCNVMIYFDGLVRKRVVQHFYNNLLPNSYLFVGHAESLYGINNDFRLVHFSGATGYLKPEKRVGGAV